MSLWVHATKHTSLLNKCWWPLIINIIETIQLQRYSCVRGRIRVIMSGYDISTSTLVSKTVSVVVGLEIPGLVVV